MKWRDMAAMSLGSLMKRKVRTILTVSGVVIGTCAIVVMISFGLGIRRTMDDMMKDMGDLTVIQIDNYNPSPDAQPLDDAMLEKFRRIPGVSALTPMYYADGGSVQIKSGKYVYGGQLVGVYLDSMEAFGYPLKEGSLPGENPDENTAVFGEDALYNFYNSKKKSNNMVYKQPDSSGKVPEPFVDPMSDKLEIVLNKTDEENKKPVRPVKLKCVGVLSEDWSKNPPPSYSVFLDVKYLKKLVADYNKLNGIKADRNKAGQYEGAAVKVADIKSVPDVEKAIQAYGFNTSSMEQIRKPLEQRTRTIQMILGGLGAVSLLVAALGIANTMIMSIYERTREIGVMKVLGCVVGDIRTMFLMEAGAIGFLGGVAGIVLSFLISFGINSLAAGGGGIVGMGVGGRVSIIPPWLAAGSLLFSTMVGLVSGFSPANRAVKISALSAIRQE